MAVLFSLFWPRKPPTEKLTTPPSLFLVHALTCDSRSLLEPGHHPLRKARPHGEATYVFSGQQPLVGHSKWPTASSRGMRERTCRYFLTATPGDTDPQVRITPLITRTVSFIDGFLVLSGYTCTTKLLPRRRNESLENHGHK
ncbi:uncharacterized protein LOC144318301 [Canis aureus]